MSDRRPRQFYLSWSHEGKARTEKARASLNGYNYNTLKMTSVYCSCACDCLVVTESGSNRVKKIKNVESYFVLGVIVFMKIEREDF